MTGSMFFFWCFCRPILVAEALPGDFTTATLFYIFAWAPRTHKTLRNMCACESKAILLETTKVETTKVEAGISLQV